MWSFHVLGSRSGDLLAESPLGLPLDVTVPYEEPAASWSGDRAGDHVRPPSPGGRGPRMSDISGLQPPDTASFGRSASIPMTFGPCFGQSPPPSPSSYDPPTLQQRGGYPHVQRHERPSELCSPMPRLLPVPATADFGTAERAGRQPAQPGGQYLLPSRVLHALEPDHGQGAQDTFPRSRRR